MKPYQIESGILSQESQKYYANSILTLAEENRTIFVFAANDVIAGVGTPEELEEVFKDLMKEDIIIELHKLCEDKFEEIGSCITEKTLKQFEDGLFWDNDLQKLLSDKDVVIIPSEMANKYFDELLESDELEEYKNDLSDLFSKYWCCDDVYTPINYLKYNL